jgi:flagellin
MGTIENRLQFSISNLLSVVESTEAARSTIVDTDFAVESALLAKGMVLQQSAAAMLTQSRAQPDLILFLLRGG